MSPKPDIYPALRYGNAPRAIEWLCRAFGFEKLSVMTRDDGGIAHAELKLGNGVIMLGGNASEPVSPRPREEDFSRIEWSIYVAVDDIDAHYQRSRREGAEIFRTLEQTGYGSREYSARDLEGFVWSFGTYRP
ncbi:MAG: VOC family protein [Gemmatimonadota bacterium]